MADTDAITKADLATFGSQILERLEASETRMLERMEASETRMLTQIAAVDKKVDDLRMEMLERIEASETRLLTAFQVWAVPVNGRIRKLEFGDANLGERLAAIEDRLMALERHQPPGFIPGVTH